MKLLDELKPGFLLKSIKSTKPILRLFNWSKYPRFKYTLIYFLFYRSKVMPPEQVTIDIFFPAVETKDYNVMIDGNFFFDQPVKNDQRTYDDIQKIATVQGDDYTTVCLFQKLL